MGLGDVSWVYDSLLHSWTIGIEDAKKYLTKAAAENGLNSDWITTQLKSITLDTIDFTGLISNSLKGDALKQNKKALIDYYKTIGVKNAEALAETTIQQLQQGGEVAVAALKMLKPEATSEELQAAFNSQINQLNDAISQVNDLMAGQFIGTEGKLYEILARVGAVDSKGVVQAGFDMVEVYSAIYAEMDTAAGKTTQGLNQVYAKLLTAQDQKNIDTLEALQNAQGMTYEALGEILAKYSNQTLKEFVNNANTNGIERTSFGKINITDWNIFAEQVFGDQLDQIRNTPEYVSAFEAYNDSLINLNRQTEKAIVEEAKSISGAKRGDWLNLTQLWTSLQDIVNNALQEITPEGYAGNVDLANRPLVPAEKMREVFKNFEDDYATLYSESFIFGEEGGDNIGVLFTSISAAGEVVQDLYDYVNDLYIEAKGNLDIMHDLDGERRNLMLYGEKDTTYEKLGEYGEDLHNRGAAADTIRYYIQALEQFGASLEDGILKISDNANMLGVAQALQDLIDASGIEIGEGLEEIQDAIQEVLKSYAEAIRQGIEGGMDNAQVADLRSKAKDLVGRDFEIDVTETAEGFKLTEQSAIKLYSALKSIDSLHAEDAFKALSEELEKTNENFKTTEALMAHITNIRNNIYQADDTISDARKKQYEAELEIA